MMFCKNSRLWQPQYRYGIGVFTWIVSVVAFFTLMLWLFSAPSFTHADDKIELDLQRELAESTTDQFIRFIVHLEESTDLHRDVLPTSKVARRAFIVQRLQDTAATSQASLIRQLDSWQGSGQIQNYRPFWIINAIAVVGTSDVIDLIAARPEVARLALDESFELIQSPAVPDPSLIPLTQTERGPSLFGWGINRVRAPESWYGLGVDGSGATVAVMDTGVDWLHPDLLPNYRGNLGNGTFQHAGNWYHAAIPTYTAPIDLWGHGTHIAGTAVGQNGIGVAPGAKWIAVAIADERGFIYESYGHAGFEWLLAPNGDPDLAPDVVNGSWSGPGTMTVFVEDIEILYEAGILPIFAAGNSGPFPDTIGAPASYPDTIAVGASDNRDEVAWFSSRGPSPFTTETHPHLIAPGTNIISTFPNNQYAIGIGTSMATPHVAGAAALLFSANSSLSLEAVKQALLTTAVPVSTTHPNNDSGWGRLDAYAAVTQVIQRGRLRGTIFGNGLPLPNVTVTLTTSSGQHLPFVTDATGLYDIRVKPDTYGLSVDVFGYEPFSLGGLVVPDNNHTHTQNVNLLSLPTGTVAGLVRAADTGAPLTATVEAKGTPMIVSTSSSGHYSLSLPVGQYELVVRTNGHRLGHANVTIQANQSHAQHFNLDSAPTILLVDSGPWYYNSHIHYYRDSLYSLDYHYDQWEVHNPYSDIPDYTDLQPYDAIIWSSPNDSPGYIGATEVLTHYLHNGGNLFISGQNLGSLDGFGITSELWWDNDLEALYMGPAGETGTIIGADDTLFAGLSLTLNGNDSANNQSSPDRSLPIPGSLTRPTFYYGDGHGAGLQSGHCKPFQMAYIGFGLEGVSDAADRTDILERAFDYFDTPKRNTGVQWDSPDIDDFAIPGQTLVYTFTMRNLSETLTDTFYINIAGQAWNSSLMTTTLEIGPCKQGYTVLTINIPPGLSHNIEHTMQVTAVSSNDNSSYAQITLHHKTPGHILLVDDDRWYDREEIYKVALGNIEYDLWEIGWSNEKRGSPPAELLNYYDIIIWYTGYDWLSPLKPVEIQALYQYMRQGGRLFLSSQDYLYYHQQNHLTRDFFDLGLFQESITPTQVYAGNLPVVPSDLAGPVPLAYGAYRNHSDGILPNNINQVALWSDQGMAAGIVNTGLTEYRQDWRLVFLSIPFEAMTSTAQIPTMNGIMGWLGDLGDSTFVTENRVVAPGVPQTYTLTLKNLLSAPANEVIITNTLPLGLEILTPTLTGGAAYDAATRQLTWQGTLESGRQHLIRYQALPHDEKRLDNRVTIFYKRHELAFNQTATVWVNAPDLSQSLLTAVANSPSITSLITYNLRLQNDGLTMTNGISAVVRLPDALYPLTDTLHVSQGKGFLANQRIHWQGDLLPGEAMTVSLHMTTTTAVETTKFSATAVVQDGVTNTQIFHHLLSLRPFTFHLPFIAKE